MAGKRGRRPGHYRKPEDRVPSAQPGPIRGLLFDLDGTLYDLRKLKRKLLRRVPGELLSHGLRGCHRRFQSLQRFRRAREAHRGGEHQESLREYLVQQVVSQTGYDPAFVDAAVGDFLYDSEYKELRGLGPPGDRQVLRQLAHRGYRLGVVSEYPVYRKLQALGLGNLPWQAMVDCEMVGTLKPSPEVFLEGVRRLKLAPEQVLMVGDRRDADVAGARAAGMPSAWYRARDPGHGGGPAPDFVITDLADLLALLPRVPGGSRG